MAEGTVFVSYRRIDTAGFAFSLHDRLLEELGPDRLFMDISSIEPGASFSGAIKNNLYSCHVLLAVIGRDWLQADENGKRRIDDPADWVHVEVATALVRKIPVIPVLVGGASLPKAKDLPGPLKELARRQTLDVRNASFRDDTDRLLETIENRLRGIPEPSWTRWTWRSAAALGLVAGFMWFASSNNLFNVAGVDDAVDGFLLSQYPDFMRPGMSPNLFVVAASRRRSLNGSLGEERPGPTWMPYHTALVDALSVGGARVIAFDIAFDTPAPGKDEFAGAIARAAQRGTTVVLATEKVQFRERRAVPGLTPPLTGTAWGLIMDTPKGSLMPVAQRGPESWAQLHPQPLVPSVALEAVAQFRRIAEHATAVAPSLAPRGDTMELRTEAGEVIEKIPFLDKSLSLAVGQRKPSFEPLRYHDVYEARTDGEFIANFKDAIVLIGIDGRGIADDSDHNERPCHLMYQALAINQLLVRDYIKRPTMALQGALVLLLAAVAWLVRSGVHPLLKHRFALDFPRRGEQHFTLPTALVVATVLYLFAALLAFRWSGLFLRTPYDVVTLWTAYLALGIAQRRATSYRFSLRSPAIAVVALAVNVSNLF